MNDKFKGMTKRELAGYVWDYYKVHIIAALIIIFIIGSLVNTLVLNPAKKQYIGAAVYGDQVSYESVAAVEALLTDALVPAQLKDSHTASADNYYTDPNPQVSMALASRFAALLMAGEIDLLIAGGAVFDELIAEGILLPLDNLLSLAGSPYESLREEWADRSIVRTSESGAPQCYGVQITDSAALKHCGIVLDKPAVGIAITSKQPRIAMDGISIFAQDER